MSVGNWWSRRWQIAVQETDAGGEGAARAGGRVKRLEVIPGGISASVQDRQAGVCSIELRLTPLTDEQWERVGELLSEQPLVSTQLVSGTVPPEIEPIFAEAGARLLPAGASEFSCQCSCCSPGPCRHLSQVFHLFAEMLNDDPGLLLVLRGRDRQQILREVSEARGSIRRSATPASGEPNATVNGLADPEPGLAAEMDQYWGNRKLIKQFHHHIAPPSVELLLLRRLGPINGSHEAMALYEQLVALYRRITEEALSLAYANDEGEDTGGTSL